MRLDPDCRIVDFRGRHMLTVSRPGRLASYEVNGSFAFLVWKFRGHEFTAGDIAAALLDEYGIPEEKALADAGAVIALWEEYGMIRP